MEKNKNCIKLIFSFIFGGIVFSSITVYAVNQFYANNISFTPNQENQDKGWNPKNVENALNDLYEKKLTLDLVYSYYPTTYNDWLLSQTVNLDAGNYLLIVSKANSEGFDSTLSVDIANATIVNKMVDFSKIVGTTKMNLYQAIINVKEKNDITINLNQNIARGYTLKAINIYKIDF